MLQTLTQDTTFEEPAGIGGLRFDHGSGTWNGALDDHDRYRSIFGFIPQMGAGFHNGGDVSPSGATDVSITLISDPEGPLGSALENESGFFELAVAAAVGTGKSISAGWAGRLRTAPLIFTHSVERGVPVRNEGTGHFKVLEPVTYTSSSSTATFSRAAGSDYALMRAKVLKQVRAFELVRKRITELAAHLRDEGVEISQTSVDCLLKFFTSSSARVRPAITATDNGTLRAVWRAGKEQVAFHFITETKINFVFFYLEDGQMIREYGGISLAEADDAIKQKNLGRLLKHER